MILWAGLFFLLTINTIWHPVFAQDVNILFEDIPIEQYSHEYKEDETIDGGELLPRSHRSYDLEDINPKDAYFSYIRNVDEPTEIRNIKKYSDGNIPIPGGLQGSSRLKRAADAKKYNEENVVESKELTLDEVENKILKPENSVRQVNREDSTEKEKISNVIINDFIRFKREAGKVENSKIKSSNETSLNSKSDQQSTTERSIDKSRPKRGHSTSQSENLSFPSVDLEKYRKSRGLTKEEWVKHPYPVRRNDNAKFDDNAAMSSENMKAPRVHFVTQRRSETATPTVYRHFFREPRVKDFDKAEDDFQQPSNTRDFYKDPMRNNDRDRGFNSRYDYYQPRFTRHYDPGYSRRQRLNPFYYDDYDRYDDNPRFDNFYSDRRGYRTQSSNRQRRIIYYATLPEVVRTPPSVDFRDRYDRDRRFEDKYSDSRLSSLDTYRSRKPYPKENYGDFERGKAPYPLQVSTDVNVREIKKNPERRIYSQVDRTRFR